MYQLSQINLQVFYFLEIDILLADKNSALSVSKELQSPLPHLFHQNKGNKIKSLSNSCVCHHGFLRPQNVPLSAKYRKFHYFS